MTWPSIIPHFRTLRAVTLLVTAALLLPASSYRNANAADPPGGTSVTEQTKKAPKNERELVDIRREMLQMLIRLDPQFREAQAAWKAAEERSAAEKAKDPRSAAARQASDDAEKRWYYQEHIAEQRSECYAKLVANRFSLDALYAPPTLSKRFEELAKQIEAVLKTRSPLRSLAERDVEIAAQLRDAQTIHTLGQLLVAAEHLRRRGKADAAARISREADLLESEFKATLQKGRERLTKLVAEEPFAIEFNPQTLQGELKVVNERRALLDELAATNASLRQVQSDLEATNDALQKATLPAERQHRAQQQAALQAKLRDMSDMRSERLGRLALNLQSIGGLHTPPDVSKQIEERLAKTLKGRAIPTVVRLLVAAEHLRRIGKSEAAARIAREADLREREFAAMLQKEKEPPTETSGNSTQPKADPAPAKKVIVLRLLDDKQVLVNNRGKIALDEFNGRLGKAVEQYKQQGVKADRIIVHLWAEKSVSCGRFDKLVADCRENHIQHYILKIPGTYLDPSRTTWPEEPPPIDVKFSLAPKKGGPPPENKFPPIVVRLTSKEDGSLAGIMISGSRLTSTTQLRDRVLHLSRRPRGADPFGPGLGVEIDANEKLLFKHLAEAVAAVSVRMGPDHKLAPLIGNVVPIRLPETHEEIEVIEGIEDGSPPQDDPKSSPRPNINLDNIKLDPPPKASTDGSRR